MKQMLITLIAGTAFLGCERPTEPAEVRPPSQVVQVVLVDGLGDYTGILTSVSHVRVGKYYDLRPYDSLHITLPPSGWRRKLRLTRFSSGSARRIACAIPSERRRRTSPSVSR